MQTITIAPPKRSWFSLLSWAVVLAVLVVSWQGAEMAPLTLIKDGGNMATFAADFFPPDFSQWQDYLTEMAVTLQIAVWGTALAVVLSIPFGLMSTNALAVANKQVDVATNNTENLDKLKTSAPEKLKELKVIWKSPLIPGDPIVWHKNLSETTKDKIYDFFMNYGKTPEEKAVLERLGWAPFRASSDLQLVPIRQLALFKEMQGVKSNKGLNEQDKLAKTTEIQAQLDDLDRLNNALSAMSSVSKAVQ